MSPAGPRGVLGSSPGPPRWALWAVATLLTGGALLVSGAWEQRTPELRRSLSDVAPQRFGEYVGQDIEVSEAEREVAGFTDYLMRIYEPTGADGPAAGSSPSASSSGSGAPARGGADASERASSARWISAYVGYYDTQTRGRTIHSPKNCLPGAGWEALRSTRVTLQVPSGEVEVNRYLLQRDQERALVLYWYQGRGRVVASEYRAKWDLLRDAALERRSDEALVRVVVPIVAGEDEAYELARSVAVELQPALDRALPL